MKKYNDDEPVTYGMLKKELGTLVIGLRGEMQGIATTLRDEMRGIATTLRGEMQGIATTLRDEMRGLDKKLTEQNARLISGFGIWRMKIEEDIADIKERMYTKEDHARDLVWMDDAMVEILAAREERILFQQQMLRMDDRYCDHEKRIVALENQITRS